MLAAVTTAISTVVTWVGTFISALVGESGALAELLPLFAVGIAVSALLLGKLYAKSKPLKKSGNLNFLVWQSELKALFNNFARCNA